jgi:hypothetical protein
MRSFARYLKAIGWPEAVLPVAVIDWTPERSTRPRQSVASEKLTCEVERYTVHKHFYGNSSAKFRKMLIERGKRTGFYTIVSFTIERASQLRSR